MRTPAGGEGEYMSQGTATEIKICGETVRIGDCLRVRYTTGQRMKGGTIEGKIVELWSLEKDNHLQGRLSCGWCFHDQDEILMHNSARGGKEAR